MLGMGRFKAGPIVARIVMLMTCVTTATEAATTQCAPDEHWVKAHHRRAYVKGNGTVVKEADVTAHCRKNPSSYLNWLPRLKMGIPRFWGSKTDQVSEWTIEERERLFEALNEIPDFLKQDFDAIHRMKNLANSDNPASVKGTTVVIYDAAFSSNHNLTHILAHEMAHRYFEGLLETERESFRRAAGWIGTSNPRPGRPAGQFLRPNGMLSPDEDFADDIATYFLRPLELKAKAPKIFGWMEKHLGPKLKRRNSK